MALLRVATPLLPKSSSKIGSTLYPLFLLSIFVHLVIFVAHKYIYIYIYIYEN
jgi:hypothetical protein